MTKRPNILVIQSDQHRYDCVGRSGKYPVKTPHMDRLAEEGMWFSNAFTPIPLCCPARQAFLNGRRPEAFGALWNYDQSLPIPALEPAEYSWPRELQGSGYRTAYFGKWHVHPEHGPDRYGFEHVVSDRDYHNYINEKYGKLTYTRGFLGEPSLVPLEDTHTHYMASECADWLLQNAGMEEPWHIRVDFHAPHLPCHPAEPFASMYDPKAVPQWSNFLDTFQNKPYIQKQQLKNWDLEHFTWEDWSPTVAYYYGFISQVDDAVGNLLRTLEELGLRENTIVVYTSDHGDMCGAHRMMDKHYILYDDVVRVPLIVRWPGVIEPSSECRSMVYNILDLPPTFMELAGLAVPEFFHGQSLAGMLRGEEPEHWRQSVISTYNGQQFGLYIQRMLRTDDWKYIWNPTDIDELYDLRNDPDELRNCIHDPELQELIAAFRRELYEELLKLGDRAVAGPWMKRQLQTSNKF